uniref:Uncharacterized protein n=1 Tax=Sipha flava TaxID=143950 RepID=A0A2S2QTG8_9HEMI
MIAMITTVCYHTRRCNQQRCTRPTRVRVHPCYLRETRAFAECSTASNIYDVLKVAVHAMFTRRTGLCVRFEFSFVGRPCIIYADRSNIHPTVFRLIQGRIGSKLLEARFLGN